VILEVRESNIAAINLYKSVGFSQYGKRENYYKNEDAILFELEKAYV
jgi:ribosomal-protein-alanine N-acetyltransferase